MRSWLPPWLEAGLSKGPNADLPEEICCTDHGRPAVHVRLARGHRSSEDRARPATEGGQPGLLYNCPARHC